jgi:hypothetical protein
MPLESATIMKMKFDGKVTKKDNPEQYRMYGKLMFARRRMRHHSRGHLVNRDAAEKVFIMNQANKETKGFVPVKLNNSTPFAYRLSFTNETGKPVELE